MSKVISLTKIVLLLAVCSSTSASQQGPGHKVLLHAPVGIRQILQTASLTELSGLGSSADEAFDYMAALERSEAPARALAQKTLAEYFTSAPLQKSITALGGGAKAPQLTCHDILAGERFAVRYHLEALYREQQDTLNGLFPPGKSANDYHRYDVKPFTTSKLEDAFKLARAAGLKNEMMTALQLMLVFGRNQALVESVPFMRDDQLQFEVGLRLLAHWYFDPKSKFGVMDFEFLTALKTFQFITDPQLRRQSEMLVADLADYILSERFQKEVDSAITSEDDQKFYLEYVTSSVLNAFGHVGDQKYIYRIEIYRGYPEILVIGKVHSPEARASAQRLIEYATSHDLARGSVTSAHRAIGDTKALLEKAQNTRAEKEYASSASYYAMAGDAEEAVAVLSEAGWGDNRMQLGDAIESVIHSFGDEKLAHKFVTLLGQHLDHWSMQFAQQHLKTNYFPTYPPARQNAIERRYEWYMTSQMSPRAGSKKSADLVAEAQKDLERQSYGSAANEALRAVFLHAEGR